MNLAYIGAIESLQRCVDSGLDDCSVLRHIYVELGIKYHSSSYLARVQAVSSDSITVVARWAFETKYGLDEFLGSVWLAENVCQRMQALLGTNPAMGDLYQGQQVVYEYLDETMGYFLFLEQAVDAILRAEALLRPINPQASCTLRDGRVIYVMMAHVGAIAIAENEKSLQIEGVEKRTEWVSRLPIVKRNIKWGTTTLDNVLNIMFGHDPESVFRTGWTVRANMAYAVRTL